MIHPQKHVSSYIERLKAVLDEVSGQQIAGVIALFEQAYRDDKTIYVCGNGGSAATAAHWVCDFSMGTNQEGKRRMRMFALGDNMAMLTAHANDISFDAVFSEPVHTYVRPGDLVLLITASGNSPNVLKAAKAAREIGARTAGLIGFGGGKLAALVDQAIVVQSREYGLVEDLHMILDHIISTYMREFISASK